MRRRRILLLLICVTFLTTIIAYPTNAAELTTPQKVRKLGIFYNLSTNASDSELAEFSKRNATRMDMAIMMVRLMGLEKQIVGSTADYPLNESVRYIDKVVNYMASHSEMGFASIFSGQTSRLPGNVSQVPSFGSVSAVQIYKSMLIALGYSFGSDFNDSNVMTAISSAGFKTNYTQSTVTYDIFSNIVYEALTLKKKGNKVTLAEYVASFNMTFGRAANELGLVHINYMFPEILPIFDCDMVENSFKKQEITNSTAGKYTEWEAQYINVNKAKADAYKSLLTSNGWKSEAVYTKTAGSVTELHYVFTKSANSLNYFAVLTLNEKSGTAVLWLAA